jgi:hypothetical protein
MAGSGHVPMRLPSRSHAGVAALLVVAAVTTASAQRELRRVFVQAVDPRGAAVVDLGAADFTIKEAGVSREVVRGARAVDPLRIALVLDSSELVASTNTGGYLIDVRRALRTFFETLPAEHEVGLFTTGRQMRVRVPPTNDRDRLLRAATEFTMDGGGNTLLNSIREIDERFMRQPPDRWPVWVIVTTDAPEMSRPAMPDDVYARLVHGFIARGASIHAVAVQFSGGALASEIAMNLTANTEGLYLPMTGTSGALAERLQQIAARIADDDRMMQSKYVLDFYSDAKVPLGDLDVGVVRAGVRVIASIRRPF